MKFAIRVLALISTSLAICSFAIGQEAQTLAKVQNLNTPKIHKKITVYYSSGHEARARAVQPLIEDAMEFYDRKLRLKSDLAVALLDRADWEKITQIPYGLPWFSDPPHVAFLPATSDGVVATDTIRKKSTMPVAAIKELERLGFDYEQATDKTVELIGLHELGHVYGQLLGFKTGQPNKWFGEFFASYFAYTYLSAKQPKLARVFEIMTSERAEITPTPRYTSLEDFEKLYAGVGPDNYGWYQGKFMGRVVEVHRSKGINFIKRADAAFPPEEGVLPVDVVLSRLDGIASGFTAWAKRSHPPSKEVIKINN